jgi:hypothetical protein
VRNSDYYFHVHNDNEIIYERLYDTINGRLSETQRIKGRELLTFRLIQACNKKEEGC